MKYKYILGYLRLSDDDEDKIDESNSIRNQRLLIEYFVRKNEEFNGAEMIFFADDGFTGTSYDRPDFKRMMELVKKERPCCIIVKDLSRFGRDTITTQDYIEKVLPFLQVRFIAVNDYYDSNSAYSGRKDTEVKFKNLINGIYPEICSQNTKQVLRKSAETGKYRGSIPPYGYQFMGDCKTSLILDPEAAKVVRLIFDRRLTGKGYSDIAGELQEKSISTPTAYLNGKGFKCNNTDFLAQWTGAMVKRILVNPVYAGIMARHKTEITVVSSKISVQIPREEWICVEGTHEAIVTKEELDQVAAMVKRQKQTGTVKRRDSKYLFSGKIKCGHCRRAVRMRAEYKIPKISCRTVPRPKDSLCFEGVYSTEPIEKLVLQLIRQQASMAEDTIRRIKEVNKILDIPKLRRRKEAYEGQLRDCTVKKMELYEQFVAGDLTREEYLNQKKEFLEIESQYKAKADRLQEEIVAAEARKAKEKSPDLQAFVRYTDLETLSYLIVQELIKVIYFYDPEHIEIVWNYRDEYMEAVSMSTEEK